MTPIKGSWISGLMLIACLLIISSNHEKKPHSPVSSLMDKKESYSPALTSLSPVSSLGPGLEYDNISEQQEFNGELDPPDHLDKNLSSAAKYDFIDATQALEAIDAIVSLAPYLRDTDAEVRLYVIEHLGNIRHPQIVPLLIPYLGESNTILKIAAIRALSLLPQHDLGGRFEPLLYDENEAVRIEAIDALSLLESEQSVLSLVNLLNDNSAVIRLHTVNALGEIGRGSAVYYLKQARYDLNRNVRVNIEAILLELSG